MSLINSKIFFSIFLFCGLAIAIDDLKDEADGKQEASEGKALWFGPRLGKRSLRVGSEDNRQTFLRLLEAADALKYYYDQLPFYETQADDPETRVTKKVVFTPKLGRSLGGLFQDKKVYDNVEFTPRLGRRIPDALPATPSDDDVYSFKPDPGQVDRRTSYFSPRLGRKVNFNPRLGRELTYDIYPEKIRLVRSTNDSKST